MSPPPDRRKNPANRGMLKKFAAGPQTRQQKAP
jgi:hypothetical protein